MCGGTSFLFALEEFLLHCRRRLPACRGRRLQLSQQSLGRAKLPNSGSFKVRTDLIILPPSEGHLNCALQMHTTSGALLVHFAHLSILECFTFCCSYLYLGQNFIDKKFPPY